MIFYGIVQNHCRNYFCRRIFLLIKILSYLAPHILSTKTIYFNKKISCIETLHEIESDSNLSAFLYTLYKNRAIRLTLTLIGQAYNCHKQKCNILGNPKLRYN